jgi:hypothetical protein
MTYELDLKVVVDAESQHEAVENVERRLRYSVPSKDSSGSTTTYIRQVTLKECFIRERKMS